MYLKSPINYIGNKYRVIEQIEALFPKKINTFIDVFGGSGTVLLNTEAEHYIYNDINKYVEGIFEGMVYWEAETTIEKVESIIGEYGLSKTNKEGFERLREDYNKGVDDWVYLYVLMCYSFNQQYRFNNNHEYNSSFGKDRSYFSDRQRKAIRYMKEALSGDIVCMNKSFDEIDFGDFDEGDLVYLDPPYYNSVGNYNDGKRGFEGWTDEHERKLMELVKDLDNRGVRVAMSNNLKYANPYLEGTIKELGLKVYHIDGGYSNCNYHKKDRGADDEVLITNY